MTNELNVWTMQQVPGKPRLATIAYLSTSQQTCQQIHVGHHRENRVPRSSPAHLQVDEEYASVDAYAGFAFITDTL